MQIGIEIHGIRRKLRPFVDLRGPQDSKGISGGSIRLGRGNEWENRGELPTRTKRKREKIGDLYGLKTKHVPKFARPLKGQDSDQVMLLLTPCGEVDTLRRSWINGQCMVQMGQENQHPA